MYEVSNIERFAGLQTVNLTYVTAHLFLCMDTKLDDTKGVIRKPKSKKYGQYNGQRKKMTKKTQTLIHKTLHLHPYLFLLIED
jgi:hypothetical protein